jgi:hypothetical protein
MSISSVYYTFSMGLFIRICTRISNTSSESRPKLCCGVIVATKST